MPTILFCNDRYGVTWDDCSGNIIKITEYYDDQDEPLNPIVITTADAANFETVLQNVMACIPSTPINVDNLSINLTALETVLQAACNSGNEQNVQICPKAVITVTSVDSVKTTDFTIPTGFRHGSIAITGTGSVTINGAVYPAGSSLNLPPMSYGSQPILYPAYALTNFTGTANAILNYHV